MIKAEGGSEERVLGFNLTRFKTHILLHGVRNHRRGSNLAFRSPKNEFEVKKRALKSLKSSSRLKFSFQKNRKTCARLRFSFDSSPILDKNHGE